MPRTTRHAPGGYVYHALNRGAARLTLFRKPADYDAFLGILGEALARHPTRLLAYCIMPTHWHFVLWPERDGQLSVLLRWLTLTHAVRWHAHYHSTGSGHVYQNRFKAFPIQEDDHLLRVIRYVERNPLRAGLVKQAQEWPWSSLVSRIRGGESTLRLDAGPVALPPADTWAQWVNGAETEAELAALRRSVTRGRPYGVEEWVHGVANSLGLKATVRPRGRPPRRK